MSQERKGSARVLDEGLLDRPLTARSIIASLLLGMHPPRLSSARLVRWCALFGVSEGTARVALSRMVERGELHAGGGVYELAGTLGRRQPAQDWVLAPALAPWDGTWMLALVRTGARSATERAELRAATGRARLGELRPGLWARPANLPRASAAGEDWAVLDAQCEWWTGSPAGGPGEAAELAGRLFGPGPWQDRAVFLHDRLTAATEALGAGGEAGLAGAFVAGAAALQHLRRDPLLPAELLPAGWPGEALRAAYGRYRLAYSVAVGAFFADR